MASPSRWPSSARGRPVRLVAAVGDDDAGRWCADRLAQDGIETRLQVVAHEQTGNLVVMSEGGMSEGACPRAARRAPPCSSLVPTTPSTVAPPSPTWSPTTSSWSSSTCRRRWSRRSCARRTADRSRVVVNASPYATVDPEAAALADPFVVAERDAALLADVGLIPRSLCVTFGRAGAVWNGLRIDSDDLGAPAMAPGGTEAFCGALAAALAAGADRASALRAAVAAAGEPAVPRS